MAHKLQFYRLVVSSIGHTVQCTVYILHCTVYSRVYQNLAILSENYRTFPKVGPHYKEKACKFLARSDYSLRPNSCVLFEIFVARRKNKYRAVIWIGKLGAQFSQNRILVIIRHLASYKIEGSFTFANFSTNRSIIR